ncbi:unnamed protein product, partial [Prorocentrum cordatum]
FSERPRITVRRPLRDAPPRRGRRAWACPSSGGGERSRRWRGRGGAEERRAETTDGGAGARGVEGAATRQDQAARRGPATGAAPVLGTALAVVASDTYAERSTPFPSSMTASSA